MITSTMNIIMMIMNVIIVFLSNANVPLFPPPPPSSSSSSSSSSLPPTMKFSIGADIGRRGEKHRSRTDRRKEIVVLLCSDKTAGESFVKNDLESS